MTRIYTSALDRIQKRQDRSRASNFIQHAESHAELGDVIGVVCRESKTRNEKDDHRRLQVQNADVIRFAQGRGLVICGELSRVQWGDADWQLEVAAFASTLAPQVKLLFQRPSRILRAENFHPQKRPDQLPTEQEWEDFIARLQGRIVMTILHPDATNEDDASYRSTVGQRESGNFGGGDNTVAGKKKRFMALYRETGNLRETARRLKVARSTAWYWTRE